MKFFASLSFFLLSTSAFAGSCKGAYHCSSASGQYVIDMSYCLFDNNIGGAPNFDDETGKGFTLTVGGKKIKDAALGAGWDGDDLAAFELQLPAQGNTERLLSVEILKKNLQGTLRYKTRDFDPSGFKTVKTEKIVCQDE